MKKNNADGRVSAFAETSCSSRTNTHTHTDGEACADYTVEGDTAICCHLQRHRQPNTESERERKDDDQVRRVEKAESWERGGGEC